MRLKYPLSRHPAYISTEDGLAAREYREWRKGYDRRELEQWRFNERIKGIAIGVPIAIVTIWAIAVLLWALFTGRLA